MQSGSIQSISHQAFGEREREREPVESQSSSRGSKKKYIEKRKAIPVVVEIGDL